MYPVKNRIFYVAEATDGREQRVVVEIRVIVLFAIINIRRLNGKKEKVRTAEEGKPSQD